MNKYCNRYIDNYPGIRNECEGHIKSGKHCVDCPNRQINREVKDLRKKMYDLAILLDDLIVAHDSNSATIDEASALILSLKEFE